MSKGADAKYIFEETMKTYDDEFVKKNIPNDAFFSFWNHSDAVSSIRNKFVWDNLF